MGDRPGSLAAAIGLAGKPGVAVHSGETTAELLGGPGPLEVQSWDGLLQPFSTTECSRQCGAQLSECVG